MYSSSSIMFPFSNHMQQRKICLAGTIEDYAEMVHIAERLTTDGNMVFLHFYTHNQSEDLVYRMQIERIDLCTELQVVNYKPGNEFIDKQIHYAMWQGKQVTQYQPKMTFTI